MVYCIVERDGTCCASVLPCRRMMTPMTKEEYERQQSIVRRVYDPDTGRHRYAPLTQPITSNCVCTHLQSMHDR